MKDTKANPMREIRVAKITLNIGVGKDISKLERSVKLLETITGLKPKKIATKKRIPNWNLRPGLEIGCMVTVRGKKAEELLKRFIEAKEYKMSGKIFDDTGNTSFGFAEYIDIEGIKYDPEIGVIGFNVAVTLERPGYRVKHRFYRQSRIGKRHMITKEEAIDFMKRKFAVKMVEEEEE